MVKERKQDDSAFKENAVERMNLTGLSRELGVTPYLLIVGERSIVNTVRVVSLAMGFLR